MRSVDQFDFETSLLKDLEYRNPVNPGGFHRHRFNVVFRESVGQSVQIAPKGAKLADIFLSAILGNGHEMKIGSDIDSCCVRIDPF